MTCRSWGTSPVASAGGRNRPLQGLELLKERLSKESWRAMTTQQWIDACLRLIGYLVSWPVVTLTIVFILRKRILSTLTALAERTRTASVGSISVEFDPIAVGALQDTAREAAQSFGSDPDRLGHFLSEQIAKMAEQSPKQDQRSISGSRILWADDNIGHNLFVMHYLQRLGARIETAATTEEA